MALPSTLRLPPTAEIAFGATVLKQPELLRRASRVARRLRSEWNVQPGDRVGLMVVPGPEVIPAILGIWMAGAAYVPLDPFLPDERLLRILRDAGLRGVVTQRMHRISVELLETWLGSPLPFLEADATAADGVEDAEVPDVPDFIEAPPDRTAYLIYTSGSTGEPKGVVCTFRGLSNLVHGVAPLLGLGPDTRHLQFASINFDASVWEVFPTLFAGGAVVQGSREDLLPGRRMAEYLRQQRVTHLCLPPSVLGQLGPHVDTLPDVACVVMAGERCPAPLAERWHASGRRVFNAYGPTEGTVCATAYRVKGGESPVPIGQALPGVCLRVVGPDGKDVTEGATGEVWIGGEGVAEGYRNQPERTRERFPTDAEGARWYRTGDEAVRRADGALVFLGRMDQQVKLRGFRIELEAIEQALYAYPGVAQAAVTVFEHTDAQGQTTGLLVAYHSVQEGHTVDMDALRAHLGVVLPDYMVPHRFVALPRLPLMPHLGKVDRQALPPPADWVGAAASETRAAAPSAPATPIERLCRAFERGLRAAPGTVTANTHFFQAGGDSLGVAHVLAQVEEDFGVSLPSRRVYSHPTPQLLLPFCEAGAAPAEAGSQGVRATLLTDARSAALPLLTVPALVKQPPRTLLLTGATGFLGIHLLAALAPRVERIHCLVRARDDAEAGARLRATARKYGVHLPWRDGRIQAVAGDITRTRLGLEASVHDALALQCDAVVHSAASISYILPYADAGKPNVDGTLQVLAFCAHGRAKPLHHVSSLSVHGAVGTLLGLEEVDEDFALERSLDLMVYENGYTRAKWVAERIAADARESGLPVSIYRPGFIQGHSRTGIGNADDMLCRLLVGNAQLGMSPDLPDKYWLPVPVDYVANATAHLVLTQAPGGTYNLAPEREQEPSHNALFDLLGEHGHPVRRVAPAVWLRELGRVGPDNALFPLVAFLREKVYHGTRTVLELHHRTPRVRTDHTRAALAGTDIQCPDIDSALLGRYVKDLFARHRCAALAA
ncbi:non-ribosomal peptide synthetase [Corallococcus carmarthensis]|uniref:Amino acid adenylation domain-containing protein n=1 Tax=Corallococcus carmarthensis TaxID=2316728 RepID=A0A3A8JZJ5_9BACT|nr:amino acid adenylation domain-containing protein [Corallococcus carmarthensis]NOK19625.1 amino acid adenylation domain-containing protein [Corallococcus carmarthensis]RKH00309.1 amino acid adenylation domain-containing protein [Corallococcus carmarthensis]